MRVPFEEFTEPVETSGDRKISSHKDPGHLKFGVQWVRNKNRLQASKFHWVKGNQVRDISLPPKVTEALYENQSDQLFVINKDRFGTWDEKSKGFSLRAPPLIMGALNWPRALAFNSLKNEIYIYNDDRGGEIFSYNVTTGTWNLFSTGVGYSLVALYFDKNKKQLYGTRFRGGKIFGLMIMDEQGRVMENGTLKRVLDFSKNRWQAQMKVQDKNIWLKVARPARPEGEIHRMEWLKESALEKSI